jgi:hypothetical protein
MMYHLVFCQQDTVQRTYTYSQASGFVGTWPVQYDQASLMSLSLLLGADWGHRGPLQTKRCLL